MKNKGQNFRTSGNLVDYACAETLFVAKACLLYPQHSRAIGWGRNPRCMTEAILQLIELYAGQVLNTESDIDGKEDARSSAGLHVQTGEAIGLQKHLDLWEVLEGLSPMQTFLPHISYTYFADEGLFQKARNIAAK